MSRFQRQIAVSGYCPQFGCRRQTRRTVFSSYREGPEAYIERNAPTARDVKAWASGPGSEELQRFSAEGAQFEIYV
ncbi:MAG: hypothetical protein ACXWID_06865 [Pyrinomonadaceae bacterium]